MNFPKMIRVRQNFDNCAIDNIVATLQSQLRSAKNRKCVAEGDKVAVAIGSRGIADIDIVAKVTLDYLKDIGAQPFIVPAMGSHGGATANGQCDLLAHYGISEATMGVPMRATMDVVEIATALGDIPVLLDSHAALADSIVPINRVKEHTNFIGSIESGLAKMLAIGLGNHLGANMYHRAFFHHGFENVITEVATAILQQNRVAFGVGIVENAYGKIAQVAAIPAQQLLERERQLLIAAKALKGKLPFDKLDLLIVDYMGKDICGTGMDTKVIGRMLQNFEPEPRTPQILRIFVGNLTDISAGNATGIGLADFTTRRLVDKMDRNVTYINGLTSLGPQKSKIPFYYATDQQAIGAALQTIGLTKPEHATVVRISNTLQLTELEISAALAEQAKLRENLEIIGELHPLTFDAKGNLPASG